MVKKELLFLIVCILSLNNLYAKGITFSLSPVAGFSFNTINEFVYKNEAKESHLEWAGQKPFMGMNSILSLKNFIINFGILSSIPVALGHVTDKDFFTDSDALSMYSYHNLITDKDYSFELNLSYKLDFYVFTAGLGLSGVYSNIKTEALDGYLQYPSGNNAWTGTEEKEYLNGTVITYEQSRSIAGMLLFLAAHLKRFSFALTGFFYPLVKIDCIDNHILRDVQFLDYLQNGFAIKIDSQAEWKMNDRYSLCANARFSRFEASGYTCVNPIGIITYGTTPLDSSCTAATSCYDFILALGMAIKI